MPAIKVDNENIGGHCTPLHTTLHQLWEDSLMCCVLASLSAAIDRVRRLVLSTQSTVESFYRATRMHGADYAVSRCLSVCLSIRLSVTRQYFVEMAKHIINVFHRRLARPFWFFRTKRDGNTPMGSP